MNRIPFFVSPYPDETLNSIISRYHILSGNLKRSYTYSELFNTNGSARNFLVYFPELIKNIPLNIEPRQLLLSHTNMGFITAFRYDRDYVLNQVVSGNEHPRTTSKRDYKSVYNHCEKCISEDVMKYGQTYWHRIHQLPGVNLCPFHSTKLIQVKTEIFNNSNPLLLSPNDCYIYSKEKVSLVGDFNLHLRYARVARDILLSDYRDENSYLNKYKTALSLKGLTKGLALEREGLLKNFLNFFGNEYLRNVNSPINNEKANWLFNMFNSKINSLTCRHILMILFLFKDFTQYNNFEANFDNRGIHSFGPWPCLNITHTEGYKKDIIKDYKVRKSSKGTIAIFECHCGFKYSKKVDNINDKYSICKKLNFGGTWEKELINLVEKGHTQKEIACRLQVSRTTVKKYAALLDLKSSWKVQTLGVIRDKKEVEQNSFKVKRHNLRNDWLELKRNAKKLNSHTNRSLYSWLYANDRDWLYKNYFEKSVSSGQERKKWEYIDDKLCKEVKEIKSNWNKYEQGGLLRMTKASIARQSTQPNLITNNSSKIPRTLKYVKEYSETRHDFSVRKIENAYEKLKEAQMPITVNKLLKNSGLTRDYKKLAEKFNRLL
jgi:hypothetical protein